VAAHHAVFDESGKADREHVIFAGLIAQPQHWHKLNQQWIALLSANALPYWRTTNAAQIDKHFAVFRRRRKDLEVLTRDLAQVLCDHAQSGSISTITMAEYNALTGEQRNRLKDPYYAAFEGGLSALTSGFHAEHTDVLTLVCDDSEEYSSEALKRYRLYKRLHPDASNMVAICFQDDRAYPPLQAADLFAFCYRRKVEGTVKGIWADVLRMFEATFSDRSAPEDIKVT
jgi:hypothetical protein